MIVTVVFFGKGIGDLIIDRPGPRQRFTAQRVSFDPADLLTLAHFHIDFIERYSGLGCADRGPIVQILQLELVADFVIRVAVIERAQVETGRLRRFEIDIRDETDPLPVDIVPALLIIVIEEEIGAAF